MFKYTALTLIMAYILDLLIGDPSWLYHPVRFIGKSISFIEKSMRKVFPGTSRGEKAGGFFTVLIILIECALIPTAVLYAAYRLNTLLFVILETFMCYQMLATKCLKTESMKVYDRLKAHDIEGARYAVSMIVGRDTENLSEEGIAKAAIETVAENSSDGIIAPVFYYALGGPVLMWIYKGINTMDSMLGYKNEKYINFGRYAAKLDDIANYIPSRLSGILIIAGAFLAGYDYRNAWKIFVRDRFNHASPNSAQTESAVAGALNIELAGNAVYFGKVYEKPVIGDHNRDVEAEDIRRSNRLLYLSSALATVVFALLSVILF